MAFLRQRGKPTFFLTYSPNEEEWPEMLAMLQYSEEKRTGKEIQHWTPEQLLKMTKKQKKYLIGSNPTVAVKMLMHRHQLFKNLIWDNKDGILGEVEDYYIRTEFQMRGSPHFHLMLWIKDSPIWKPNCPESEKEVIEFVNKYITCSYSSLPKDVQQELATQVHYHTFSCVGGHHGGRRNGSDVMTTTQCGV